MRYGRWKMEEVFWRSQYPIPCLNTRGAARAKGQIAPTSEGGGSELSERGYSTDLATLGEVRLRYRDRSSSRDLSFRRAGVRWFLMYRIYLTHVRLIYLTSRTAALQCVQSYSTSVNHSALTFT